MKVRPGDALQMVEKTFGPVMIVEWNSRKYLAPPPVVTPELPTRKEAPDVPHRRLF